MLEFDAPTWIENFATLGWDFYHLTELALVKNKNMETGYHITRQLEYCDKI
jgi:hypothetical protein